MKERSRFYLVTAIAMNVVMFWGFSQTYFAPLLSGQSAFGGNVSDLPFLVHLHGWSFFLWYLLLLWQAVLIRRSHHRLHRRTGILSIGLVAIMTLTGFVVMVVNIHQSLQPGEPPLWRLFGPVILAVLFLFLGFYVAAVRRTRQPEVHKRYMLVASAAGLGAATFRILLMIFGPNFWNIPAGILMTNLFIVAGMLRDRHIDGRVHKAYWVGLIVCVLVEIAFFVLPHTAIGTVIIEILGATGAMLRFLY